MSTDLGGPAEPPSYEDAAKDDSNGTLQPTILVLAGQSIHAESADSAPLYQLNRGVASLSHATSQVQFERIERTVKTGANGEPAIKPRIRHIYNLNSMVRMPGSLESLPSDSPQYFIRAVSRRTIGSVGLKKPRFRSYWKALPVDVTGKKSDLGLPQFVSGARSLFEIHHKRDRYEWTDGDDHAIAVEDEGEHQHRLVITASLQRETMDALVALWCCRIWQYSADHKAKIQESTGEVRRKLRLASETPTSGNMLRKLIG